MKYRKKPVVIEAIQYNEIADGEKMELAWPWFYEYAVVWEMIPDSEHDLLVGIETLEGRMEVSFGDWIIKDVNGDFYPCKPDIFEKTYEKVKGGE